MSMVCSHLGADKVLQSLRRPPSKTDASLTPSSSALLPLVDSMKGRKRNVRKGMVRMSLLNMHD